MTVNAAMAGKGWMIVILGPTASGKSALADAVCRRLGAQIVSIDSMQVYCGMDIGTAKPTAAERVSIPHHLVDVVEPDQLFTAGRFVELAEVCIADAQRRSIPLVATGGTPLYYKAVFEGLFEGPPADPVIRQRLQQMSGEELHQRLAIVDRAAARRIHPNDTRRMVRALEIFELTGQPISSFQTHWASPEPRHRAVWFGLLWEKETLNRRINARVKAMIAAGWIEETQKLLDQYGALSATASEATGYRELITYLEGQLELDAAVEQIKMATRQLARRQMKWFKRFPNVRWLPGDRSTDENAAEIVSFANS